MRAVDCQGLGGAFTLGTVQAGFDVVGKVELPGGFGMESCLMNRHLLGAFEEQVGPEEEWDTYDDVAYVFGNPPCSGFSTLNTAATRWGEGSSCAAARGAMSSINDCMKALVAYAGRVPAADDGKPGPPVVVFESVQQAGKRDGRELMRWLRDDLEVRTGRQYDLTLLFVSGAALGAAQVRKRFFFVAHRMPFGITPPDPPRVAATYRDAIEDLQGLKNTWEEQPLHRRATAWGNEWELRRLDGVVDAHAWLGDEEHYGAQSATVLTPWWRPGERLEQAATRAYDELGRLPSPWLDRKNPLDRKWGFQQPIRVHWDKPGYVVYHRSSSRVVHPEEDRLLSIRELARLQGFPDTWSFNQSGFTKSAAWIGKGVPVQSGRWVSEQVRAALEGTPGPVVGEPVPDKEVGLVDREYVIDITNRYELG